MMLHLKSSTTLSEDSVFLQQTIDNPRKFDLQDQAGGGSEQLSDRKQSREREGPARWGFANRHLLKSLL